jgi:hypothetical protein
MQRIKDQDEEYRSIAWKALSWLVYAYRPLSLGELQHALMIEAGDEQLDEEAVMDGQGITGCCAGFVVIDQVRHGHRSQTGGSFIVLLCKGFRHTGA